ncbi:hypothetical protein ABMA27_012494 [Loxostege sticticalis]|uniref:Integrase catalytic domain-containing protein n=1 Tax=Loxostege sticticalis TaxID=481309 RepID=A0ABR3GYV6_LOXSC
MSEDNLSKLVRKRGSVKGRLTKLKQYIEVLEKIEPKNISNIQIKEIEKRLEKCEELNTEFNLVQLSIEECCDSDSELDKQIEERETIESDIIYTSSFLQDFLEKCNVNVGDCTKQEQSSVVSNGGFQSIKLPTINLPTFNGSYLNWLEFRDTFESLIISNASIPDINKFHYLRSSLQGGAIQVIKSLEFTSANFKVAWELLCDRYDNKKILINNHLNNLFSTDKINHESHTSLRYLVDHVSKNLRALNTLGQPTEQWDSLIIYMITAKLDSVTSLKWEEHKNNLSDLPTLENFFSFIRNRADILETLVAGQNERKNNYSSANKNINYSYQNKNKDVKGTCLVSSMENISECLCLFCSEQGHKVFSCEKFKKLSVEDRMKEIVKLRLCTNCLGEGHKSFNCRLKISCRVCKKKHNSLLHISKKANKTGSHAASESASGSTIPISPSVTLPTVSVGQVLLSTAMVNIVNSDNGQTYPARALLDTGSQSSFITESLKKNIMLSSDKDCTKPLKIVGINNVALNIKESCTIHMKSRCCPFERKVNCLVVPQITGTLPSAPVNVSSLNLPKNLVLADPNFHNPSDIDILLGADVYWEIVGCQRLSLGIGRPVLQESELGWIISGPTGESGNLHSKKPGHLSCNFTKQIHDNLQRFWEVEELHTNDLTFSPEEKLCENHFVNNHKRLLNGRFSVKIPFKEVPEDALGDSFYMARKRLLNLEKKFQINPKLKQSYSEFIEEYRSLGHLKEVQRPEFGYYLPHHAVLREKSETTKLRVVFDASAKTTSGKSLNDIQYVGPVIQDDLFTILIRFRSHKYVVTGDIKQMYRQIEVDESQRHLQLILWREDRSKPIQVLQLNTVTYGTASAPFLSTRCILQLAHECSDPEIANIIQHDIYMDDLSTGCQSENDIKRIYDSISKVLSSACFPLHKIRTNCPQALVKGETTSETLDFCKESTVLGLHWSPTPDILHFDVNLDTDRKITKRTIISLTCKIFDPLGLLCACIIKAKIILQQLWKEKLGWDDEVPQHIAQGWSKVAENLSILSKLNLERNVVCDNAVSVELHCFVDASQEAFGACVYLRSTDPEGNIQVRLLCAKARVAPIKLTTIPRLELCGALLGAQLTNKVINSVRFEIQQKTIWTDSTVVLGWIKAQPKLLKTFVANRVIEINELTQGFSWRHVPGDLNPADLASRGVDPQRLLSESLWWEGPPFLRKDLVEWPQQLQNMSIDLPELKTYVHVGTVETYKNPVIDFGRYSNFSRLRRIFAYVLRFINNCKGKNKITGCLNIEELDMSLKSLIKISQAEMFHEELKLLSESKQVNKRSNLLPLNPFIDSDGIIRVGGRLKNSLFDFNKKHPIILSAKHRFTKLLMSYEHNRLFHVGPQQLLSSIREVYWPIGGRTLARAVVKKCVICARYRGSVVKPIMGNLPSFRTESLFPFYSTGTDFAGPFYISSRQGRGNRITKCYLCIFICLSTRAVHLEVVSDLSTQAFIACLRRFVSRRGKPKLICCDNGTNFVGANNELGKVLRSSHKSVNEFANSEGIQFKFSPAYSPHLNGAWEIGVKAAKFHLKRVVGNASLTFEDLCTVFTQIEAILNSRPLSPLSSDPSDLNPLTPGHFLIGRALTAVPSIAGEEAKPNYKLIARLRDEFWKRWSREFVAELQQRNKWRSTCPNPCVGDMVVVKEENLPPQQWRLGRITALHMGSDEVCRVVDIYTAKGTIRRAIHNVVRLPLEDKDDLKG